MSTCSRCCGGPSCIHIATTVSCRDFRNQLNMPTVMKRPSTMKKPATSTMKKPAAMKKGVVMNRPSTMAKPAASIPTIECTHCSGTFDEYYFICGDTDDWLCHKCWINNLHKHDGYNSYNIDWDQLKFFGQIVDKYGNEVHINDIN